MAITFVEQRKKQKRLLLVFGVIIVLIVIVLARGFLMKKLSVVSLEGQIVAPTFKKPQVDFTVLESKALKDLEPFEEIKPFEGKAGRENPFIPY